jgi:uncharacterized protein (DUF697 family)
MVARTPEPPLPQALQAATQRCKRLLARRALVAAAAGAVPVPGLDWAVDAALLSKLLPQINEEFGLSPSQIEGLDPHARERVKSAITLVGTALVGKLVTKEVVLVAAKAIGLRMTAAQAVKFVPLAGTVLSAGVSYAAVRWLGEQHIKDCVRIVQEAKLVLPAPEPVPSA